MTDKAAFLKNLSITSDATVRRAMEVIDQGARQIALIVAEGGRLAAIVTDGDIRRGLLKGVSLDAPVTKVMRANFIAIPATAGPEAAHALMIERRLYQLPSIDGEGRPVDLFHIDSLRGRVDRDTRVVLMAGGLGTRLRPLTETIPKPMLPIGGQPILELILRNFVDQGFRDFTVALNYKGEMIREYFGDGAKFNARIEYVEENKRMGTAGALSLLSERPQSPFIVMNGDLLTSIRFDTVVQFHQETNAQATMCAREYTMQVPFGVIEMDNTRLTGIVEKPTFTHFVNAGIYILSPDVLDQVRNDEFLDMPTLLERAMKSGERVTVFPVQEYWLDIGRPEDLERARVEYGDLRSEDGR